MLHCSYTKKACRKCRNQNSMLFMRNLKNKHSAETWSWKKSVIQAAMQYSDKSKFRLAVPFQTSLLIFNLLHSKEPVNIFALEKAYSEVWMSSVFTGRERRLGTEGIGFSFSSILTLCENSTKLLRAEEGGVSASSGCLLGPKREVAGRGREAEGGSSKHLKIGTRILLLLK